MLAVNKMTGFHSLTIDGREPPMVFNAFDATDVPYTRTNLDVGDFQIASDNATGIASIAERKPWADLCSSISSNHLAEQMSRMVEKCRVMGARPLLIVEYDNVHSWESKSGGLSNKFIDCVLLKYSIEGVSVLRTSNSKHTRDAVAWLLARCCAGKIPEFAPTLDFKSEAGTQKFHKKNFAGNPWQNMLTAIRGVSKAKSLLISAKFGSAQVLVRHLRAKQKLDIKGIGKVLEAAITQALLGNT